MGSGRTGYNGFNCTEEPTSSVIRDRHIRIFLLLYSAQHTLGVVLCKNKQSAIIYSSVLHAYRKYEVGLLCTEYGVVTDELHTRYRKGQVQTPYSIHALYS